MSRNARCADATDADATRRAANVPADWRAGNIPAPKPRVQHVAFAIPDHGAGSGTRGSRRGSPLLPEQSEDNDQGGQVAGDRGRRRDGENDPAILEAQFPHTAFRGNRIEPLWEYVWVVDPIDGTKAFVREYPMFSTQIALMHRGRLIVGVSSAPAYGELAYGEIGVGAWLNEQPIRVSTIDTIEAAALSTGNLKSLATGPRWPAFGQLVGRLNRIRGYGDFCTTACSLRVASSGRGIGREHSGRGCLRRDRRSRWWQVHGSRGASLVDCEQQRASV
jgi:hypothetical protein